MTEAPPEQSIVSPCVRVCIVDGESGLCVGCLRTLPEIAAWGSMTPKQREAVMADLPARRGRVSTPGPEAA